MSGEMKQDETGKRIVPVLACVLNQLCARNDKIPLDPNSITKFHALRPPAISIQDYLERIAKYAACSGECFVLALVYIDRIIQTNHYFLVNSLNVHRLLITSVMLAAKFFDDQYFNNAYYGKVGGVPCKEINSLEIEFLFMVNFNLFVTTKTFDQYNRELCNHTYNTGCFCQSGHPRPFKSRTKQLTSRTRREEDSSRARRSRDGNSSSSSSGGGRTSSHQQSHNIIIQDHPNQNVPMQQSPIISTSTSSNQRRAASSSSSSTPPHHSRILADESKHVFEDPIRDDTASARRAFSRLAVNTPVANRPTDLRTYTSYASASSSRSSVPHSSAHGAVNAPIITHSTTSARDISASYGGSRQRYNQPQSSHNRFGPPQNAYNRPMAFPQRQYRAFYTPSS